MKFLGLRILIIFSILNSICLSLKIFNSVFGEASYDVIRQEFDDQGSYKIKYHTNEVFPQNFNDSAVKNVQDIVNLCLKEEFSNAGRFQVCICTKFICVKFYCNPNQILNCFECKNVTIKQDKLPNLLENPNMLFLKNEIQYFFKVKSTKKFESLQIMKSKIMRGHYPVVSLIENKDDYFDLFEVEFEGRIEIDKQEARFLVIHTISVISLLILIIFFECFPEAKSHTIGKCWVMYAYTSFVNYLVAIYMFIHDYYMPESVLLLILYILSNLTYSFTEYSVYFWLNIISFDAFRVFR